MVSLKQIIVEKLGPLGNQTLELGPLQPRLWPKRDRKDASGRISASILVPSRGLLANAC